MECTESLGALFLEKSSNKQNKKNIVVECDYIQWLKPFQIHGIRFLYNNYLKGGGAVLNDDDSLGKTVQTVLFLFAIQSNTTKKSLIVCSENKQHHWLDHFNKWTNIKASLSHQDVCQASVVITPSSNCSLINDKKWNVIVIDNLDFASCKEIQNANCAFKLWIADKNIKGDVKNVYKVLRWITCNNIGTQKKFEASVTGNNLSVVESWRRRQYLNLLCNKWLLRRTTRDVKNQLPFINIREYRNEFENWLKSYKSSCENTSNNSITSTDDIENGCNKDSEDENNMESSPSLLDLTSKSDVANSPKKRKKGKDDTGLMTKRSKPDINKPAGSTVERNSNTFCISLPQDYKQTSDASRNVESDLLKDGKRIKSEFLSEDNADVTVKPPSFKHGTNNTIEPTIKLEDERDDSTGDVRPKFGLLGSLFSDNHKASKSNLETPGVKQEFFSENPDNSDAANIDNNVKNSEKKMFKLLDRFFS